MNSHNRRYIDCSNISKVLIIIFFILSYKLHSQCTVTTINHDFELPVVSFSAVFIKQNVLPGWKTTSPDGIIEFWKTGSMGGFAYSGNQYIELNAFYASGLYQDYDSSQSTVFNYSFAHRGRFGTDKMVVKAGPPGGPYTIVTTASTSQLQWKLYKGVYTAPNNQKVTRFIFEAVSTATNDQTAGNFLDAINFSATLAPPVIQGPKTICYSNSVTLTASGKANSTFNWYDTNGKLVHKGITFTSPPLFIDTSYNVEQISSLGCKSDLQSVTIKIDSQPVVTVSGNTSICSNELTDISFKSPSPNVIYTWTIDPTGVIGASAGSGNRINQLLKTTSNTIETVTYNVVPKVNGCAGDIIKVEIKVNPLSAGSGVALVRICSGESPKIKLGSILNGTSFNWTVVSTDLTGASNGSGDLIDQILETRDENQGSVVYNVTSNYDGCSGKTKLVTVVVNPLPKPILRDGAICIDPSTGGAIKTYNLDSTLSSTEYDFEWYYNLSKVDKALSNTLEASLEGEYAVIAINKQTGCVSYPAIAKVEAFPTSSSNLNLSIKQISVFSDYSSTILANVKGSSDHFEYQLDNENFAISNEFTNVKPGSHRMTAVSTNGCINISKNFFVIWYPPFLPQMVMVIMIPGILWV